jgi:LCP family protein required for cell wall assembly
MLVPGAGQLYAGARRRAVPLLAVSIALLLVVPAIAIASPLEPAQLVDRRILAGLVLANLALLGLRLFAVVDAWRCAPGAAPRLAVLALVAIATATAVPHVAAGYVTVRGYDVLDSVFADSEPGDVLVARGLFLADSPSPRRPPRWRTRAWPLDLDPAGGAPPALRLRPDRAQPLTMSREVLAGAKATSRPWVTMLLLGSDEGPGQPGDRTDTMILVALQHGTRRAAAFGVPRNLVEVPVGGEVVLFREPLNHLYRFAAANPGLFPGGRDAGATALKHAISRLLGVRVDYYAMVDLLGFADLVDALGGVDIRVRERLEDEVTRPAWGEPKPTIDVFPGRSYHFFGREALAYVRSRNSGDDYARMGRQRCFLSAMASQIDVVSVLRNFDSLATTVKSSVETDIPLARLPELIELAAGASERRTVTVTFGADYFARRREDGFPVPDVARIRDAVREAILRPPRAPTTRLDSIARAC